MSDNNDRYNEVFKDLNMNKLFMNNPNTIQYNTEDNSPKATTPPVSYTHHDPEFILPSESYSIRERIRKYSNTTMKELHDDTIDESESVEDSMVQQSSWNTFRKSGLLWFINTILHTFGWAIVVEVDDNDNVINAYPSRVKFRGFSEELNTSGYRKVAQYMKDNADTILSEMDEE